MAKKRPSSAEQAEIFEREFPEHAKIRDKAEKEAIDSFLSFLECEGMYISRYRTEEEKAAARQAIEKRYDEEMAEIDKKLREHEISETEAHEQRRAADNRRSMDLGDFRHHEDDPISVRFPDVVAQYYDIDQKKFEQEKRKMLDAIRCRDLVG